jgi:uncharacterized protein YlxW (UPF0749 family)
MTTPGHERTTERSRDHRAARRRWRIGTPLVFALSGALFLISANDSQGTDLRPGRVTTMASLVRSESANVERLQAQARDLTRDVDDLSAAVDDATVQKQRAKARAMRGAAGFTPVTGSGITVTLADAPREVRESSDRDLREFVVHQQDIQAVVNAMWDGGARAITIQGQRIISTTGIKCAGNSVELHGIPYPQPYVITAVGDTTALQDRLDSDPYVLGFRRDAADPEVSVGWSMQQEAQVTAPAYGGIKGLTYARPASD